MSLFVKMDDVHGRCDFDGDGRICMLTALERIPYGGCTPQNRKFAFGKIDDVLSRSDFGWRVDVEVFSVK